VRSCTKTGPYLCHHRPHHVWRNLLTPTQPHQAGVRHSQYPNWDHCVAEPRCSCHRACSRAWGWVSTPLSCRTLHLQRPLQPLHGSYPLQWANLLISINHLHPAACMVCPALNMHMHLQSHIAFPAAEPFMCSFQPFNPVLQCPATCSRHSSPCSGPYPQQQQQEQG
jgi:hypothetical protein